MSPAFTGPNAPFGPRFSAIFNLCRRHPDNVGGKSPPPALSGFLSALASLREPHIRLCEPVLLEFQIPHSKFNPPPRGLLQSSTTPGGGGG